MEGEVECAVLSTETDGHYVSNGTTPLDFTVRLDEAHSSAEIQSQHYVCRPIETDHGQLLDCRIQTKESTFSAKTYVPQGVWLADKPNFPRDDDQDWINDGNSKESVYLTESCKNDTWLRRSDAKGVMREGRKSTESWLPINCGKPKLVPNECEKGEIWVEPNKETECLSESGSWLRRNEMNKDGLPEGHPEWGPKENWMPDGQSEAAQVRTFSIRVSEGLIEPDHLLEVKVGRKRARRKKNVECFKCEFCPLMTLDKNMMTLHAERKGACVTDAVMVNCPGCSNIFYSVISLRMHLAHDHNMLNKDVKSVLVHLPRVTVTILIAGPIQIEKPSCLYDERSQLPTAMPANFNISDTQNGENQHDLQSCSAKGTLLEAYLDAASKKDCSDPNTESSEALLENTFNFTAPVSEQLPSIQPEKPPAASGLDEMHLLQESQEKIETEMASEQSKNPQELENDGGSMPSAQMELTEPTASELIMPNIYQAETFQEEVLTEYVESGVGIPIVCLEEDVSRPEEQASPPPHSSMAKKNPSDKKLSCGFRCDINGCKVRMQSEENIAYHRRCHEGQMFNCPECCQDHKNWDALRSHLWQSHEIDMELYKCDRCNYRTLSYSRLTNYHRGIHGNERSFLCDICGKGFKTVKQMRNHKVLHRKTVMPDNFFECDFCDRTYRNKPNLINHISSKHKNIRPYLCSTCGYRTDRKFSLELHMRKHSNEKPYACKLCNYKSKDHNALRRHQHQHTGKFAYKCSHCSYKCVQASSFKNHTKTKHPGLEGSTLFGCEHCPFETISRERYIAHATSHTGYYPAEEHNFYPSIRNPDAIVDLSHAQSLIPDNGYYEVEQDTVPDIQGTEIVSS